MERFTAGSSALKGPATSQSLTVKYSSALLLEPGSPVGLSAWYRISVVDPRVRRLQVRGGVAPGNRPVQSPRHPTGRSGVGLKSDEPSGACFASVSAAFTSSPRPILWLLDASTT